MQVTSSLVLLEEFIPLEYHQKLAQSSSTRRRLPSLFTPKSKQWKPAATLNSKPYEVEHLPHSPTYHEVEFEGLLHADNATKVILLAMHCTCPCCPPPICLCYPPPVLIPPSCQNQRDITFPPLPSKHDSLPRPKGSHRTLLNPCHHLNTPRYLCPLRACTVFNS
jgi:hypothetical protein